MRLGTARFGLAKVPLLANGHGRPTRLVHLQGRRVGTDGRSQCCYPACVDEHFTVQWGLPWWRRWDGFYDGPAFASHVPSFYWKPSVPRTFVHVCFRRL